VPLCTGVEAVAFVYAQHTRRRGGDALSWPLAISSVYVKMSHLCLTGALEKSILGLLWLFRNVAVTWQPEGRV